MQQSLHNPLVIVLRRIKKNLYKAVKPLPAAFFSNSAILMLANLLGKSHDSLGIGTVRYLLAQWRLCCNMLWLRRCDDVSDLTWTRECTGVSRLAIVRLSATLSPATAVGVCCCCITPASIPITETRLLLHKSAHVGNVWKLIFYSIVTNCCLQLRYSAMMMVVIDDMFRNHVGSWINTLQFSNHDNLHVNWCYYIYTELSKRKRLK